MTRATRYKYVAVPRDREIIQKYIRCSKRYITGSCDRVCGECEYRMNKKDYLRAQMLARF